MMVKPTVKELLTKVDNRFQLVSITARRARQIAAGDDPLIKTLEEAPVTIAANEILQGKVYAKSEEEESQEEPELEEEQENEE